MLRIVVKSYINRICCLVVCPRSTGGTVTNALRVARPPGSVSTPPRYLKKNNSRCVVLGTTPAIHLTHVTGLESRVWNHPKIAGMW